MKRNTTTNDVEAKISLPAHLSPKFTNASVDNSTGAFLYADGLTLGGANRKGRRFLGGEAMQLGGVADHRLVKASKSPTGVSSVCLDGELPPELLKRIEFDDRQKTMIARHKHHLDIGQSFPLPVVEHERGRECVEHGTAGAKTVIEFREWEDAYRIRTEVTVGNPKPPEQEERISDMLTHRAARKIAESCEYMALQKGGYKTFVTFTLTPEARERVRRRSIDIVGAASDLETRALYTSTEITSYYEVQKEVSRCMDAMQKLYQRGFEVAGQRLEEHPDEKLAYCWVVEIPKNEHGGDNPHVHMLLGWSVPYQTKGGTKGDIFAAWAKRVEKIWGNGTARLEKIKAAASAGAYMAKAAGYMSKAQGNDSQGTVKGNRYGISSVARAPAWVKVSEMQLHTMGQLIADVDDHISHTYADKYSRRKQLNEALINTPKDWKDERAKIGAQLEKARAEVNAIPVRASKYQIVLKGAAALVEFLTWAKTPDVKPAVKWLPEKPEGEFFDEGWRPQPRDGHFFKGLSKVREKYLRNKQRRHALEDDKSGLPHSSLESWALSVGSWKQCAGDFFSLWDERESHQLEYVF